jgi:hypothetical protein
MCVGRIADAALDLRVVSTDRADDIVFRGDSDPGRTVLRPAALAAAVRDEISTYGSPLHRANVAFPGPGDLPVRPSRRPTFRGFNIVESLLACSSAVVADLPIPGSSMSVGRRRGSWRGFRPSRDQNTRLVERGAWYKAYYQYMAASCRSVRSP